MKSPKEKFVMQLKDLRVKEPFTKNQKKSLTIQQQNFVRGIQIARGVKKREAISLFKKSQRNKDFSAHLSDEIAGAYESGIILTIPPMELSGSKVVSAGGKKIEKPIKKKDVYKYKKKVKKDIEKRFTPLGGTSRRYIDTKTGEEISRRERDKRLSE